MVDLHTLKRPDGSHRDRKRVGRGPGSGLGKTAGRGQDGQKSRSGASIRAGFEGGQMPLQRRIPKRGFTNRNRTEYQVVNLSRLERIEGAEVTPETLRAHGLVRSLRKPVKILGVGDVTRAFTVSVHGISEAAKSKIVAAGGSVELISSQSAS